MPPLPQAGIPRGSLPLTLPMDVHIDRVAIDDDPFDREVQGDFLEALKVRGDVALQTVQRQRRKHHRLDAGKILRDIGPPECLDGHVNPLVPRVIRRVPNIFGGAAQDLAGATGKTEQQPPPRCSSSKGHVAV